MGCVMCLVVYIGFVLSKNNFHKVISSFKFIDSSLFEITRQKSELLGKSNRFQLNVIVSGLSLIASTIVVDSIIFLT